MNDQNVGASPAASLEEVLITDQLAQRPSRPPDYEGEAKAVSALAQAMAAAPETVLQELVNQVLTLCRADSAGVSLLEPGDGNAFHWPAIAGAWASLAGSRLASIAAPCAVVIDRDQPILFDDPGRVFRGRPTVSPAPAETLLVPFHAGRVPIGTVWAVAHSPVRQFDTEDVRLLTSLSRFASAAHQMTAALRDAAAARARVEMDSRAFAQSIVDTMRDPFLVLNADLRVISASREFYRNFGVSPEETEGKLVYELGNRQWEIPRLRTLLEEILPRETTFWDFEVMHTFERIGRKVMLLNARKVYREGDGSGQILLVIEDVTERRDAEKARREAEARFTEMVKNVRDHSIFLTDPEGVITSWNIAAERIVGYSEAEAVGRHFSLIFSSEDIRDGVPEQELRQAREEGRAEDERWHLRKGGEPFWALGIVTPLHEPEGHLSGFSKILRDITDRKRSDEALRESERKYRDLVNSIPAAVYTCNADATIAYFNARARELWGCEPELHDRTWTLCGSSRTYLPDGTLLGPADSPMAEALATGEPVIDRELRIERPDGSVIDILVNITALRDPAGNVAGAVNIFQDITTRKLAEAALRESQERLRLSLSAARMGIWTWDVATDTQARDANLNRLLGLEPVETRQPLSEFLKHHIHPADREAVAAAFAVSVEQGRPLNFEFRVIWPDGTVRWLRDQGDILYDGKLGGASMAGACVDFTDLKEAEAALRESEERLRLIVESATDYAILTQAPDRTVTSWSPGAVATFGYSAAERIGRSGDILFTPEDLAAGAPEAEARTALREGRAADERWHMRKDGTRFYASGVLTPLGEGGSRGFVKVLRDLTDRKRMEDRLQRAHDELEQRVAERTVDLQAEIERRKDLTRRLATAQEDERRRVSRDLHDSIGQLLAGLSMAFKAVETAGELPPLTAGKLVEAKQVVEALGKEAHGLAVRLRPTSLDDIGLESALGQLVAEWSSRTGVRADFHSAGLGQDRLNPEIETTLYRVVQEALTNVAKHARASVVSVVVRRPDGYVTAVIEDDGTGFGPETAPKGRLGIVGMNERVALVSGELDIESEPGSGTTVYVRIPVPAGEGGGP